jgi:spore coat protein U-like protein
MSRTALTRLAFCVALTWGATAGRSEAACTITSTGVSFGAYDVFTVTPTNSTGSVQYDCLPQDNNIRITLSTGSGGSFNPRTLKSGTNQLLYNLYLDAALTTIWGDGTGGSSFYFRKNPPSPAVTVTVYGRIPALQDAATGSYSDAIVTTIDF